MSMYNRNYLLFTDQTMAMEEIHHRIKNPFKIQLSISNSEPLKVEFGILRQLLGQSWNVKSAVTFASDIKWIRS